MNLSRHLACALLQALAPVAQGVAFPTRARGRTWPASVRLRVARLALPGARALRSPRLVPPTPTRPWRPAPLVHTPLPDSWPGVVLPLNRRASDWDTRRTQALGTWTNAWWRVSQEHEAFLPLHAWNLRRCTHLVALFWGARRFNAPLWTWNTRQVRDLTCLLDGAESFHQPLWTWRLDQVKDAEWLLANARAFHQPLWPWRLSSLRRARGLLYHVGSAGPLHPWPAPSPDADWTAALAGPAPHGPLPHWPADVLAEARGSWL